MTKPKSKQKVGPIDRSKDRLARVPQTASRCFVSPSTKPPAMAATPRITPIASAKRLAFYFQC